MARTAFLGTPAFALSSLEALARGSELVAVVAQPDRAVGRGQHTQSPPVAQWAKDRGLRLLQPGKAKDPVFLDELRALALDLIVVAAYGKILPVALLELPRLGCVNVHASLLPKYRGAAPIQWAIARGERESGITLMQMDEGLDTGPMLAQARLSIGPDETGAALAERLAVLGGQLLTQQLPALLTQQLRPAPQDHAQATLAPKLSRSDALLDFRRPAAELHDRVRAFTPWPGALIQLDGKPVKVSKTAVRPGSGEPGWILSASRDGIDVGTGGGTLRLLELQREGKRAMAAGEFLAGHPLAAGDRVTPAHSMTQSDHSGE